MPWCDDCAKYLTPSSLRPDGTCPTCGRPVAEQPPEGAPVAEPDQGELDDLDEGAPWHFKLLVVMLVVYLGWRFAQLFL